jgi:hypothetical protein
LHQDSPGERLSALPKSSVSFQVAPWLLTSFPSSVWPPSRSPSPFSWHLTLAVPHLAPDGRQTSSLPSKLPWLSPFKHPWPWASSNGLSGLTGLYFTQSHPLPPTLKFSLNVQCHFLTVGGAANTEMLLSRGPQGRF